MKQSAVLETPIAFLIFNRPDLTKETFSTIASAKPRTLFLIADGPRNAEDVDLCKRTREIVELVDWECNVHKNFSDHNLGCGLRESSGFDWVFSQVERAIFLEDDTKPSQTFFTFCERLLERYADDQRIMHITGNNFQTQNVTQASYYFSKYVHAWGWASWRRAWRHYDYKMTDWPYFKNNGFLRLVSDSPLEEKYWSRLFDIMHHNPQTIDTWDYQWLFACWAQNGLVATPRTNLVSNIGFGRIDAAHTKGQSLLGNRPLGEIAEIEDPKFIVRHREADRHVFDHVFGGRHMRLPLSLLNLPRRAAGRIYRQLTRR